MLSVIISHAPIGLQGEIVSIEVDIRNGLPGIEIVGLPDSAVKEAKERVRVSIRNSGFQFPVKRILVNMAPAGIRKAGAAFDLPIALGILIASEQFTKLKLNNFLVLGELNLRGEVRPVKGVLSAIATGVENGFNTFLVPLHNLNEARALGKGNVHGIANIKQAVDILSGKSNGNGKACYGNRQNRDLELYSLKNYGDLADIKGHAVLKRALEIAAAGRHHLLLFGPPGSGKTMAVKRLPTLFPLLSYDEALAVTRIHSLAGLLVKNSGLITNRPFRIPHHSASHEGLIGGGKLAKPGEVTLAHEGILFLDEAPEFRQNLLQGLREPIENGKVTIVRAGTSISYPSQFQLILTANPCACGNLGREERVCYCSILEVQRYWKRMGGALLDRIDIRVPVKPVSVSTMVGKKGESSKQVRARVANAIEIQRERYKKYRFSWNSRIPPGLMEKFCCLDTECALLLAQATRKLSLSSRACHSILKVARTIADLAGKKQIREEHILEAVQHRRYGEEDTFWSYA